jgi:glycosyltransferase involved in cell wall biosynthesis
MNLSIVIPLFNEHESLPELTDWIKRVVTAMTIEFEVIFVDDGSTDNSWNVIENLASHHKFIKGIRFRRNYGKSAALFCGFDMAQGDVVITMDGDLQDSPDEIPELYNMVKNQDFDLVSGWKKKRYDPVFSKNIPSKLYNATVRFMTGTNLHDINCGLKAYKKQVIKSIEVYGEMHRCIPVIAKRAGFNKIGEKVVTHYERKYGVTKFGISRFSNGLLDLMSVMFITKFGKRPMHLFGTIGIFVFMIGFLSAAYLGVQKLFYVAHHLPAKLLTSSPYFFLALTAMVIGTQLFLSGFIGELVSRNATERNQYLIDKRII